MTSEAGPERARALDLAIAQIEKQFGKGAIVRLGGDTPSVQSDAISSGSIGLDLALGVGGIPRGRVIEVFGPESSGKTTLALSIIAQAQKSGGTAVFIDAEHALQPSYAKLIGVDIENLHVSQPDTGEEALEIADQLVRSGAVDVIVIDSVAALVPRAEIEGEMGDAHVGLQARLMSQALRKLTGSISKSRSTVVFINQIRMRIGVMFGNPETTTGGNALKFYASLRLDIRKVASIKEREEVVGNRTRVRVVKNKVAPPFRAAEFDIMFDEGISRTGELIDLGIDHEILVRSGTWISYGAERLGQGRENARRTLRENRDLADKLEGEVRAKIGLAPLARGSAAASAREGGDGRPAEEPAEEVVGVSDGPGGRGGRKRERGREGRR
ncbi:MAG: recombinase RecA [Candidatus Eisenbacteria bacterium]|nr:recombinase RecA [Candidatus Eisenbacteria bacterium]